MPLNVTATSAKDHSIVCKVPGLAPSTHQAGQFLAEVLAHQHARHDVLGVQEAVDVLPYGYDCGVTHIT